MNWLVSGSGGGGKSGGSARSPIESPDSLHSKQLARLVEIVSEGEIEGLVGAELRGVYLNDTPVQNADGSYNFTGVKLVSFIGTPNQDYVPGFSEAESEHVGDVGLPARVQVSTGPLIRTIPARDFSGADAIRVTLAVPGLSIVDTSTGDINGTSVQVKIEVRNSGGAFQERITDTISGKTTSRYQRDYRITLPADEEGPWDVRVTRITPDAASSSVVDETWWDSYTVITETKMRYTHSAGFGIEIDSSLFSSIPTRAYHIKGIKVKIPTGYDPIARTYPTFWDGTFNDIAWTDNPVWCWYDMLTSERYGLGKYINPESLEAMKWELYNMSQYCDELVPDGHGALEPRFTCNAYFQTQEEAFTFISNMASIFRAMPYGSAGGIALVQDAPREPIALYTAANVVDQKFKYSGSSIKARHTVVLVSWNDPADMYRQKIEYVPDLGGIKQFGIVSTSVVAMGCTSRGQAVRFGEAIILAEKYEDEALTFDTGLDSLKVYPGCVFQTRDPNRTTSRFGGRILSATPSSITLDAPVELVVGVAYTLKVMLPDMSVASAGITSTGSVSVIELETVLPTAPQRMAIWVIESQDEPLDSWVCLGIAEKDLTQYSIAAKAYYGAKYPLIDDGLPLPNTPVYNAFLRPQGAEELTATLSMNINGTRDILVSWKNPKGTIRASLTWSGENSTSERDQTTGSSYTIKNVSVGIYNIYVTLVNAIGISSGVAAVAIDTTTGRSLNAPTNLTKSFREGLVVLTWYAVSDGPRLVIYEIRKGANFLTALKLGTTTSTEFYVFGDGDYWVRAISSDGEVTSAAVTISITGSEEFRNIVASYDEQALSWPGTITGPAAEVDGFLQVTNNSATYTIPVAHDVDVGTEQICRCLVGYQIVGGSDVLFSTIPQVSLVSSFIGGYSDSVSVLIEMSIAGNDGVYGDWIPYHPGGYLARKFKFRITFASSEADTPAILTEFITTVDMPDRTEVGASVAIAGAGTSINFSRDFQVPPAVQITIFSAQTGDLVVLDPPTAAGFTVQITNAGLGVARNINWTAQGY